jgi:uncharacterized membrane protein
VGGNVATTSDLRINVGPLERGMSLAVGAVAGAAALRGRWAAAPLMGAAAAYLVYRGLTGRCTVYRALGVTGSDVGRTVSACSQVTVQRPAAEVYRFLRDSVNIGRLSSRLDAVLPAGRLGQVQEGQAQDQGQGHEQVQGQVQRQGHELSEQNRVWRCRAGFPGHGQVEWEVRLTVDEPPRHLAWTATPGSPVPCALEVRLQEAKAGTAVFVDLWIVPPSGPVAAAVLRRAEGSRLLRRAGASPSKLLQEELRRLRQVLEAGETATVRGQSAGRERRDGRSEADRAAQVASVRPLPAKTAQHATFVGPAVPWQPELPPSTEGRRR